jgi:hypothetical protein
MNISFNAEIAKHAQRTRKDYSIALKSYKKLGQQSKPLGQVASLQELRARKRQSIKETESK